VLDDFPPESLPKAGSIAANTCMPQATLLR
jgi:hypothetical protein